MATIGAAGRRGIHLQGTIILAECEDEIRNELRSRLESLGHVVHDTTTVSEAADQARNGHGDIVVVDVDVPDGKDWDLLAQLRTEVAPVVVITREDDEESIQRAMNAGIHDQVAKPLRGLSVAARIAGALETSRLRGELNEERQRSKQRNGIDQLTGMMSRQRIEDLLSYTAAAANRYGHPLSIVLADLDHFAKLNRVHGSDAANHALSEIGHHLVADLRSSDMAGRWDGDEFLVILPHTDLRGATLFSRRLQMTFSELPVRLPSGIPVTLPASFGCAEGTNAVQMIERASERLTNAKRTGRNTVSY